MRIKYLKISNFKNLNGSFDLSPKFNLIIGDNGLGKTNFLESIHYLSKAGSFKHHNERNLIHWDTNLRFTKVEADIEYPNTNKKFLPNKYSYIIAEEAGALKKNYLINNAKKSKNKYSYSLPTITFLPEHIDFISGSPDIRRNELDDFLSLVDNQFKYKSSDYGKILKQRNKLLKRIKLGEAREIELGYWDEGLIDLGSQIIYERIEILKKFLPYVKTLGKNVFKENLDDIEVNYKSKISDEYNENLNDIRFNFENKILAGRDKEIGAGLTLYGPQRDDIEFMTKNINRDISLHEFGSRGQQRLISLIFKLAMWFYYEKNFEKKPILLLDDVMSEVDAKNRKNLEDVLGQMKCQVFASSTTKNDFSKKFLEESNFIKL